MIDQSRVESPEGVPEISGSRVFDAPRDLVFDAFSSPGQLGRWWGPTGFTLTTSEMTFAPGGEWRFVMHGPDGRDYRNKIVFRDIEWPDRIAYIHPGDDGTEPVSMETTILFVEQDGKTRVTWRMRFPTLAERNRVDRDYGASQGLAETMARLGAFVTLSFDNAFVTSRHFDASPTLLWAALTEPDRMAKWFGPKGLPAIASKMDFRPGGQYHYGLKTPEGGAMWGRFVYRDIRAPSRIVLISGFSDEKGGVSRHPLSDSWPLETLTVFELESHGKGVALTITALPINATEKERLTFSSAKVNMVGGWNGTFEQLREYLASV
jgi:uncharacterized protein YndB with AHSA1/START domain